MNIRILFTIIGLFIFNLTFGQDQEKYSKLKKEAESFYKIKEFQKSADKYKEAFDVFNSKAYPQDRYNSACSYALAGNIDNSFYHLFRMANAKRPVLIYEYVTSDINLKALHGDKRWNELILIIKKTQDEKEKFYDKQLIAKLDSISQEDQKYRMQIDEIENEYGRESNEMKKHWKIISEKDSINLIKVEKILNERGWLGAKIIGEQGNSTLFLVIQHSNLKTQLKYLPMMRDAVKKRNAEASSLALLEDRVALGQGKRQIYGSQIHSDKNGKKYVAPLVDPENVDKRRAEVGLGTLADYVEYWNLTWDIEKHKERVAKIEAEAKKEK